MVNRYDVDFCKSEDCDASMTVAHNGEWVSYDDYAELEEKVESLIGAIEEVSSCSDDLVSAIKSALRLR